MRNKLMASPSLHAVSIGLADNSRRDVRDYMARVNQMVEESKRTASHKDTPPVPDAVRATAVIPGGQLPPV